MFPIFTSNYVANLALPDVKCLCKIGGIFYSFGKPFSNINYIGVSESCSWMIRSDRMALTAFLDHVPHIVKIASGEKVERINTIPNIAAMKDFYSVWYFSLENKPRNSMCKSNNISKADDSVSIFQQSRRPKPASVSFLDSFKKPLDMPLLYLDGFARSVVDYFRFTHTHIMFGFSGWSAFDAPASRAYFRMFLKPMQA